jgi:D-serine deaminase-like pyridoxal phosphate-dependent protein
MDFSRIPPQTPALVIDLAALEHNIATMQRACDAAGVRLRPHGKMHKCSTIARLQIEAGAAGLCCQSVGEAEVFARAGIADILVSSPVPPWGPPRLAALVRETGARVGAVCDSAAQIERLSHAAGEAGVVLGCTVDIDIGMHRAGCAPAAAPALAALAARLPGLSYDGVQAYFGHLQHRGEGRAEANAEHSRQLSALVVALSAAGLAPPCVTGGGSGTYALDLRNGVFTELQCGSYAVMDSEYEECGAPEGDWPFARALYLAATVVSAQHATHVTIDAGLKAVSIDVPPRPVHGAAPGSLWRPAGDEHGAIVHPLALTGERADGAVPPNSPREGEIVWLQPGHCDPTINLHDGFWVAGRGEALDFWPIDARRVSPAPR